MKAAMAVQQLQPSEKLEWAERQRIEGNKLFSKGLYKEAMDVYLTCLVAADNGASKKKNEESKRNETDISSNSSKNEKDTTIETSVGAYDDDEWEKLTEEKVKLPVLLNLSLCTLKLSMYKKTCTFCDLALEMECGKIPKVYFRRGKARTSLGFYNIARQDLQRAIKLLDKEENNKELSKMKSSVEKEMSKLDSLMEKAEQNKARQEKAMKRLLGGKSKEKPMKENTKSVDRDVPSETQTVVEEESLYTNFGNKREFSTLRAPRQTVQKKPTHLNEPTFHRRLFAFFVKAAERGLRSLLYLLGDEDAMTKSYDEEHD